MPIIDKSHLNKQVEVISLSGEKRRFWVKRASGGDFLEVAKSNSRRGHYCTAYQSIKVVKEKPDDVYDPDNRKARVDYTVKCLSSGTGIGSRKFDTCGEMGDGAEVFHEVLMRSKKNARLLSAIKGDGNGRWFESLVELDRRHFPACPAY